VESGSAPGLGAAAAGAGSGSALRHSPDTPLSTMGAARQPSDCSARAPWSAAAALHTIHKLQQPHHVIETFMYRYGQEQAKT